MRRRNLLIGSACLAAGAACVALTPRKRLSRLGEASLAEIAPTVVQGWTARDVSGLAPPSTGDELTAQLYDQIVERSYRSDATGEELMALLAHGANQTNEKQLHRPEVCYPAFGFRVSDDRRVTVAITPGAALPARRFVAQAPGDLENVLYWTRIGDFLPTDNAAQRYARLRGAIDGFVCDGLLARFSVSNGDPAKSFALINRFVPEFLAAVNPTHLPAFVGLSIAGALKSSKS